MEENQKGYQKKIITIPNILSFFRLCLIPVIIWLYCAKEDYHWTMFVLILSGITDIVDGIIARKFGMVSDFGKALDPVADKLTQIATLFCLVTRFRHMMIPLVLLMIKEVLAGVTGLMVIRKTQNVMSAEWHGKATTVSLYTMMVIHLLWFNIPTTVSNILIGVCVVVMLVSFFLYTTRNIKILIRKENN